ncbi:TDP-N-acetylfucosamine:lipid II N-acetylfucosaminyltransferase [Pontibacter arcticus]|uniref:4-alpha-L-fucosyltransferase glycosyl transferase group 56 n=1 Tax=Pontibacter arcticus TaxID=2080288 RepID=A0A364RG91_9BACT|nr:TDP-N-acetylfucosamine:lipid II N-acetylfucosaminyltransferase [Pontibacter arcticus]RAU83292.1 hypothetical protein DP923_08780 [Pontibacter arcticus]
MLKILHVVSDDKFIDGHLLRYTTCENHIVSLKEEFTYNGKYINSIEWIKPTSESLAALAKKALVFDCVIIYHLDLTKAKLINSLDPNIKVIWHFFGAEVYHMIKYRYDIYSDLTKKALGIKNVFFKKLELNYIETKATIKDVLTGRIRNTEDKISERAIKRVNFFLAFDYNEYKMLKKKVHYLPEFLALPLTIPVPKVDLSKPKKSGIILGNSRSPSNNHLDILDILLASNNKIPLIIPYSYTPGNETYGNELKSNLMSLPNPYELLEDFIPFNEYVNLIGNCSTAVFNSYRQMALGNVLISLINGVKVYLSVKNPSLKWLKNLGFIIFSIEGQLEDDLKNNKLQLSLADCMHNRALYNKLNDISNNDKFIKDIQAIVDKHEAKTKNII